MSMILIKLVHKLPLQLLSTMKVEQLMFDHYYVSLLKFGVSNIMAISQLTYHGIISTQQ